MQASLSSLIDADADAMHSLRLAEAELVKARAALADAVAAHLDSTDIYMPEVVRASEEERRCLAERDAARAAWEAAVSALVGAG